MTANQHPSVEVHARLALHVSQLCAAFGIVLEVRRDIAPDEAGAGFACEDRKCKHANCRRAVRIAPVTDESTYCVALHEIGHCLSPMGMLHNEKSAFMRATKQIATKRDQIIQLEEERAAWDWAQHYALEWTPVMESVKRMCLGTYEQNCRRYFGKVL